jgi:hypothetical protein
MGLKGEHQVNPIKLAERPFWLTWDYKNIQGLQTLDLVSGNQGSGLTYQGAS